jgi:hypothetical protein
MMPLEAVRLALSEVGDVSDAELAVAVGQYGVKIPLAYVPVAKAQLRGLQALEESRKKARELLATIPPEPKRRGGRPKHQEEPTPQA